MGVSGSLPVDLILFGMIAAFLVLRLRGILGRRTGFERPPQAVAPQPVPVVDGAPRPAQATPPRAFGLPETGSAADLSLARMKEIDRAFDPAGFLRGADGAFRMIVGAFAAGDRATLRGLLSEEMFQAFDLAIAEREKVGRTAVSEVRAIQTAKIDAAELAGTVARIGVAIVSDQVNLTKDKDGLVVSGADAVTELHDIWTFERDLTQADPAWRLVAARSA